MYVGSDGKLHFVNRDGADTVLPFSSGLKYYIGTWTDSYGGRYDKIYVNVPTEATNWKFAYGYLQFNNDTPPTSYSPTATTSGTLLKCGKDSSGTYVETIYQRYNYGSYILFY